MAFSRRRAARAAYAIALPVLVMLVCALSAGASLDVGKPAAVRPPSDLPLGHWSYPLLERLSSRGYIEIDLSTRPVSRSEVATALLKCGGLEGDDTPVGMTEREKWTLDLLEGEFLRGQVDRPLAALGRGGARVGLGLLLGTELTHRRSEPAASVDITYELWGGIGGDLGFYSDSVILLEGQEGPRVQALSSRARSWRGSAVYAERAYLKYERDHFEVAAGRRGIAWGRSPDGRLLISDTATTLDGLEARFSVGALLLHSLHAVLEGPGSGEPNEEDSLLRARGQTYLAAHRGVVRGSWGSIAVGEVVVYSGDTPDPAYLNPLLPYYVSQHNERADDNVLWSLDLLARPASGLDVWGEFLVDDLQYDRDTGHPDKYGATVGAEYFGVSPLGDFELSCEYTNVRKWTYTHHVAGHAYTHDGRPLGFELGPDADRLRAGVAYHPSPCWTVDASHSYSRTGEGSIAEPFKEGDDDEPTFPSGTVSRMHETNVSIIYDRPGSISIALGGSLARRRGGAEEDDSHELWLRIQFRI